jgi:DNA-binding MarR family transcriptional regulator
MSAATATAQAPPDTVIIKRAHAVWEVMQREAANRGLALTKDKRLGDGRVLVATIGAFIKALSKERNWNLSDAEVDAVRRYLKATGNVVVLNKVEQYRFRIFVRETWSNEALVTERDNRRVGPTPEDKVTPAEAGETREPGKVVYRCADCGAEFATGQGLGGHRGALHPTPEAAEVRKAAAADRDEPLGDAQVEVMQALAGAGGRVASNIGATSEVVASKAGLDRKTVTRTMGSLERRGLVTRKVRGKRTYAVELTDLGWETLRDPVYRPSLDTVADHLQTAGEVKSKRVGQVASVIAREVGLADHRVRRALDTLEDEGLIKAARSPGGYLTSVRWVGDKPAVVRHPRKPEPESTPEQAPEPEPERGTPPPADVLVHAAPNDRLLAELARRLHAYAVRHAEIAACEQKLALIRDLVAEANDGKATPLKALADIQEALTL